MEYGLFYQLPSWPEQDTKTRYDETIAQIVLGDQLGFDVAWLAEMHFQPEYSVMPSPIVVGAAVAAQTQRIRIGTGVILLPLHDPLRAAEDAATLDILSNGRLEYGIGRGGRPAHYYGFGIPVEDRDQRFTEALEVLLGAWNDPPLTFHGQHFNYQEVNVTPKPLQRPHPRLRIAANSGESLERAAQLAIPIMITPITNARSDLIERCHTYRRIRESIGKPATPDDIAVLFPIFVHETGQTALDQMEDSMMRYIRIIAQTMLAGYMHHGTDPTQIPPLAQRLNTITYSEVLATMCIAGDPDQVLAGLQRAQDDYGTGQIMCWFNAGGLIPHTRVTDSMHLFMREVTPRL